MAKMPDRTVTTARLLETPEIVEEPRPYLGMSILGHGCRRALWYGFRWTYKDVLSRRLRRLFNRGHREEHYVIQELERIGIKVTDTQLEFVDDSGHIKGHCDGICINVPEAPKTRHILEVKTASDKKFKEMQKQGLEKANLSYYAQCQLYMRFAKLNRTLFIMVNKNDDSIYVERVKSDFLKAQGYLNTGFSVVMAKFPPEKRYGPTYFACRWCPSYHVCHKGAPVEELNCRTCVHAVLCLKGGWYCMKHERDLSVEKQREGCETHELIEELKAN